ncbi:MAG TPA: LptF/LptG family permease [Dinghuibacter sp.]|jgi:lipopolysaccharide export system permease protein|uniref:LptF/LptG family permease n=1 Tax=Dinghuibacter sp. TaxID=2024697 RepID=UPI002C28CCDF|nr:LptF/LptG family permease [Dinghuibacter sp.]HTJ13567.1 LptF/LptG family permease [Dinghuibacter sp.]
MKKLDWYILRKFLSTFFFAILLFTLISVVVDISEKTDDFVKSGLNLRQIIMQYYIGFVPYIIAFLFPLFVFLAVIFFASKMAARTEVIAILSAGVSFRRYLRAFVVGGVFLGLLLWWADRIVVPKANQIRTDFQAKYVDNDPYNPSQAQLNRIHFRIDPQTYAGMAYYDTLRKTGSQFFMYRLGDSNKLTYNLRAEAISWDTSVKKWRLDNLVERKIDGLRETVVMEGQRKVNLNVTPSELNNDFYIQDKLTTPELDVYIKREKLRGAEGVNTLEVERYRRDATPVAVFLLTMIGAVIASRKIRGGSGVHLALGILISAVYIISNQFSTVFSTKGNLPPFWAAWIPNFFFAIVAWYLYRRAPK